MKAILKIAVIIFAAALGASAVLAQTGMSSTNYRIPAYVINSGGGIASSTNYTLIASIGEPIIGPSASTNFASNAGFLAALQQVIGKPGDLNYDGVVDILDAKLALQIAAGLASGAYPGVNFPNGDIVPATPDGKIDLRDADRLIRFIVGKDTSLP